MKTGIALVLSTAVISGVSIYLNKFAVGGMDSSVFTFSKNLLVTLALLVIALGFNARKSLRALSIKQWGQLTLIGLVGGSLPFLLFFEGLKIGSAATGSFIHKLMFLGVTALAIFFLKERVPKKWMLCALMAGAGNWFLLGLTTPTFGRGEAFIVAATALWAIENILSKHLLNSVNSSIVALGRMGFGAIFIFVFLLVSGKVSLLGNFSSSQLGWIGLTAALLLGYILTWYHGLAQLPVSAATMLLLLGSPITTLLSVASGSPIDPPQWGGLALLILGVILATHFIIKSAPAKISAKAV